MKNQSFEDYYYKNIHAEGCGCSELVINNYEIERKSLDPHESRPNPIGSLVRWVRRRLGPRISA